MYVSKRDIEAFLNEQKPLIHRRSRPPKQKREFIRQVRKPGQLSIDAAYIRRKDFEIVLGKNNRAEDYMRGNLLLNEVNTFGIEKRDINSGKCESASLSSTLMTLILEP